MAKLYNLARMTTVTTGTGTITLGSAVSSYLTFSDADVSDGDIVTYGVKDGTESEIGTGTYTSSGTTLTRTVLKSTNADAAISLSGTAQVFITPAAEDIQTAAYDAVINGGLQVWQNATTITGLTHLDVTADMFIWGAAAGTSVFDMARSTDTPDDTVPYSLKIDCTTAEASPGAGVDRHVRVGIEGIDFAPLDTNVCTLNFWIKSNKTGTYCVAFTNSGRDRTYVVEYTIDVSNTWEEKTIPITFDAAGGAWSTAEGGFGLGVRFSLIAGTTYQTTADTWNTGNFIGTSGMVNFGDSASNEIFLAKVQLVLGSTVPTFVPPPYHLSRVKCSRYFRVITIETDGSGVNVAYGFASTVNACNFDYALASNMFKAPAVRIDGSEGTDWYVSDTAGTQVTSITFLDFKRSKDTAKWSTDKTSGYVAGDAYLIRLQNTAGRLVFDANL